MVEWAALRCGKREHSAPVLAVSLARLAGTCHLISLGPSCVGWKTRDSEQTEMDASQTAFKTFKRHQPPPHPDPPSSNGPAFAFQASGSHSSKQIAVAKCTGSSFTPPLPLALWASVSLPRGNPYRGAEAQWAPPWNPHCLALTKCTGNASYLPPEVSTTVLWENWGVKEGLSRHLGSLMKAGGQTSKADKGHAGNSGEGSRPGMKSIERRLGKHLFPFDSAKQKQKTTVSAQ